MAGERAFDPNRVAYFEGEGWRAYYDRRWFRLLRLVVSLSHEQFRIPYPQALLAAYYVTRASVAWVPSTTTKRKFCILLIKLRRLTPLASPFSASVTD